ncbi:MAG: hypothetical protein ACK4PR_04970 [Gammaproteobacteria bacterium]
MRFTISTFGGKNITSGDMDISFDDFSTFINKEFIKYDLNPDNIHIAKFDLKEDDLENWPRFVQFLKKCTQLEQLKLHTTKNYINFNDLVLNVITNNTSLSCVDLSDNNLDDAFILSLADAIGDNHSLNHLILDKNNISEKRLNSAKMLVAANEMMRNADQLEPGSKASFARVHAPTKTSCKNNKQPEDYNDDMSMLSLYKA